MQNTLLACIIVWFSLTASVDNTSAEPVAIPNFWDSSERFAKPDIASIARLKFLTTTDFPPFNFIDRKKRLTGFNIDLVRAICEELQVTKRCQIQALPWAELREALTKNEGDAIIAGIAASGQTRQELAFTRPYLRIPGRFIVRRDSGFSAPAFEALFRKTTGIISGSSHEQYFKTHFDARTAMAFADRNAAFQSLQKEEIDAVFADALSLSFWLSSEASKECCQFLDGPFQARSNLNDGMTIALPKDRLELTNAINFALSRINAKGKFAELYLRYFPMGLF
ncbi:MAG: transporter substrate-binding domain-containing protein [Pseudomonadota bacterium]